MNVSQTFVKSESINDIISKNGSLFYAKIKEIQNFKAGNVLYKSAQTGSLGQSISLNQEEQFKILKPFGIIPLFLRLYRPYYIFTFSSIKNERSDFLLSKLNRLEGVNFFIDTKSVPKSWF